MATTRVATLFRYLGLSLEEVCIDLDVFPPFIWSCRLFENSGDWTCRLTGTTVNTLFWINIELCCSFKFWLTLRRMNAVNRADIYTRGIFYINTWLSNYIGHCANILLLAYHVICMEAKFYFLFLAFPS